MKNIEILYTGLFSPNVIFALLHLQAFSPCLEFAQIRVPWWHISAPYMKDKYVNMQEDYVNMHDNYVDMQDKYVDMQVTHPFRDFDFDIGKMTY